jgi:hypothetical protein
MRSCTWMFLPGHSRYFRSLVPRPGSRKSPGEQSERDADTSERRTERHGQGQGHSDTPSEAPTQPHLLPIRV